MTAEQWQRIDQLFHAVLACEPGERTEFLANQCAGDEPLRREVESLLSSLEEADDFIETPAGDVAAELLGTHKPAFEPGQQIENYRIVRELGSGGMGEVYLADDLRLNRKIALKLLPPHFTVNPDRVRRFEREARAASALNHPNIVTIHEIGHSNTTHFIATEFVDGKTLRQLINEKPFTLNETLNVSMQIADALEGAHAAGIVHRDIKPENIMVRRDGYVKILDFGLAKLTEQQTNDSDLETPTLLQSNPGLVMGTVQYMSPEQARAKNVGVGTDIWSLGIVMYELLAGHVPFNGETSSHVMVSLMEDKLPPLRVHATVPDELDRFVTKALRKNQKERYQTAVQLARDLKHFKQKLQRDSGLNEWLKTVPSGKEKMPGASASSPQALVVATDTAAFQSVRPTTSAEYMLNGIRRHRGSALFALTTVLLLIASLVYFSNPKSRPAELNLQIKSIAVLPLKNLSGDAAQDYLADGMTEAMINELAQIGALRVISRQSTIRYKDARKTMPEIARELNVDVILDGSVLRSGDRVRITTQLIRAATDEHLWSESYERDQHDMVALKGEIARAVAGKIKIKLTPQEQERLVHTQPINPAAHEAYLKGSYFLNQAIDTPQSDVSDRLHKRSIEYFKQAVKLDTGYSIAHSGLARAYHWLASSGFPEFYPKAKEAALKAIALDDTLAEAHGALAFTIWRHEWDFEGAEREFRKADALAPISSNLSGYAFFLSTIGRHDEAIQKAKLAEDLDPLTLFVKLNMAWIYLDARQHENAIAQFQRVLELDPDNFNAHEGLGVAYVLKGMYTEGIAELQTTFKLSTQIPDRLNLAWGYAMAGKRKRAIQILNDLKSLQKQKPIPHLRLAVLYGALGEKDLGIAQMEMAYTKHLDGLLWLKVNRQYDGLRSDPRFTALMRRIGLPE